MPRLLHFIAALQVPPASIGGPAGSLLPPTRHSGAGCGVKEWKMEQMQGEVAGVKATQAFAVETTSIGLQSLISGVSPIMLADRLAWRAAAPLCAKKPQRPLDHGLFDLNARNQLELFASVPAVQS